MHSVVHVNFLLVLSCSALLGAAPAFPSSRCPCASSAELDPLRPGVTIPSDLEADTYGIGCKAHDQNRSVCKQAEKECLTLVPMPKWCADDLSWCPLSWCYIQSPLNCSLPRSRGFGGRFLSYATCGHRDRSTAESQPYALKGQVLSISYRQPSTGWKGSFNPAWTSGHGDYGLKDRLWGENVIDDKWYGPMVDLVAAAAHDGDFLLNTTDAPDVYKKAEAGGSRNHQCVYATALGYLDICVALLPMKDAYTRMAPFFTVLSEDIYMVSPLVSVSLLEQIWGFLSPFDTPLWFAIIGFVALLSMMFMSQECYEASDFAEMGICMRFFHSLYLGFTGFFSGGSEFEALSIGGRLINVGFVIFALLVVSAYTANLAADLVVSTSGPEFSDFQSVLSNGNRICGAGSVIHLMKELYPSAVTYRPDKRSHVLKSIDDGLCDVAVVYQEDLQVAQGNGMHCDKVSVGLPVLTVHKGLAINPLKDHAISWYLQRQINLGKFAKILNNYRPTNQCDAQDSDDDGQQFSVLDMLGTFAVSGTLAIVGVAINFIHRMSRKGRPVGEDGVGNAESKDPPVTEHVDELTLAKGQVTRLERKVQELEAQAGRREYGQQPSAQIQKLLQDLHDRMMELQCLPDLRQRHGDAIYPQWV